jgi:hypothetical protein
MAEIRVSDAFAAVKRTLWTKLQEARQRTAVTDPVGFDASGGRRFS